MQFEALHCIFTAYSFCIFFAIFEFSIVDRILQNRVPPIICSAKVPYLSKAPFYYARVFIPPLSNGVKIAKSRDAKCTREFIFDLEMMK